MTLTLPSLLALTDAGLRWRRRAPCPCCHAWLRGTPDLATCGACGAAYDTPTPTQEVSTMSIESLRAQAAAQRTSSTPADEHGGVDRPPIWRPAAGEELHGRVVERVERESRFDGQDPYLDLTVEREDGERVVVRCGRAVLARLVQEHDPQVGDEILVVYHGLVQAAGGHPYHDYSLAIEREPESDVPVEVPTPPRPDASGDGLPF